MESPKRNGNQKKNYNRREGERKKKVKETLERRTGRGKKLDFVRHKLNQKNSEKKGKRKKGKEVHGKHKTVTYTGKGKGGWRKKSMTSRFGAKKRGTKSKGRAQPCPGERIGLWGGSALKKNVCLGGIARRGKESTRQGKRVEKWGGHGGKKGGDMGQGGDRKKSSQR